MRPVFGVWVSGKWLTPRSWVEFRKNTSNCVVLTVFLQLFTDHWNGYILRTQSKIQEVVDLLRQEIDGPTQVEEEFLD